MKSEGALYWNFLCICSVVEILKEVTSDSGSSPDYSYTIVRSGAGPLSTAALYRPY